MSQPTSIVIFGASGDLTRRKLVPGLFNLYIKGRLPAQFQVVGNSRSEMTNEAFRERMFDFAGLNEVLGTQQLLVQGKRYENIADGESEHAERTDVEKNQ